MDHETGRWHSRTGTHKHDVRVIANSNIDALTSPTKPAWVFIMKLHERGDASVSFPDGCYVTNVGWETPEVGDRNLTEYYSEFNEHTVSSINKLLTFPTRLERTYRFKLECFGNDELNGYTAEQLIEKRFSEKNETDPWFSSYGYEVMVDHFYCF